MDWLSMYGSYVDCLRKKVVLYTLDNKRICFVGERRVLTSCKILALIANRMLKKRCDAFLACVVSSEGSGPNIADIPVVWKFLDVFSE